MKLRFTSNYTTQDELDYIHNLGSFRMKKKSSRLDLLKKYKKTYEKRVNWGEIDKTVTLQALEDEIEKETNFQNNLE